MKMIKTVKKWFGIKPNSENDELEHFMKEFQLTGDNDFRDDLRKILLDLKTDTDERKRQIIFRNNTIYIINGEHVKSVDNCSDEFIADVQEILPYLNGLLEVTPRGIFKYCIDITEDKCIINKKCLVEFTEKG